jgi:plastocyanin
VRYDSALGTARRCAAISAFVLLPAVLAAGCGGGSGAPAQAVTVMATDTGFNPATVSLDRPGTYTFHEVNNGTRKYALDVEGNGVDQDGDPVDPGKTFDLTVDLAPGTYTMHSQDNGQDRTHEIKGTIVVRGS